MTEPVVPDLGALPWKPKRELKLVRELSRWDVPTSGILRHRWRRQYHLFRCLDGASAQYSAWVYVPLGPTEARALMHAEGQTLRSLQNEILLNKTLSIAVAEEEMGIIHRFEGRLAKGEPEPRFEPQVGQQVQEVIQEEVRAIQDMPVFA